MVAWPSGLLLPQWRGVVASILATYLGYRISQTRERKLSRTFDEQIRRTRVGALVCDYVDIGALQTLARQYSVQPEPDEVERKSGRKRSTTAQLGTQGSQLGAGAEETEEFRALYHVRFDPNILTERLIDTIDSRDQIRKDLASIPAIGLAEIEALAKSTTPAPSAAELLEALVSMGKREQYENVSKGNDFILAEASWFVTEEPEYFVLNLAELKSGDTVSPMPNGVALRVRVPHATVGADDLITAQGRQRFRPKAEIRAVIFGRPGYYDNADFTLYISPVTVFSRVGRRVV